MKEFRNINILRISSLAVWLAVSVVIIYTLYDTLVFRVTAIQKIFAAVISCVIVYLSGVSLFSTVRSRSLYWLCFILLLISLIGLFFPFLNTINTRWIFSDLSCWILLCSFLILVSGIDDRKNLSDIICSMVFLLWICGVAGYLFGERMNGRFEPPALFTVAGLPLILVYARNYALLSVGLSAHFVTGCLCLISGERTSLTVWFFFSFCALGNWFISKSRTYTGWFKILTLVLLITTFLLTLNIFSKSTMSLVQSTRVYKIFSSPSPQKIGLDQSLLSRIDEVNDSWDYMKKTNSILGYFFGFGHGASFPATLANRNPQNMDQFGMLHNIHFSPMLIFFRYGLVGIFIYVVFFVKVMVNFVGLCVRPRGENGLNSFVISGIATSYLLSGFMRNEFVNPLFLFVAALFLTQGNSYKLSVIEYEKSGKIT